MKTHHVIINDNHGNVLWSGELDLSKANIVVAERSGDRYCRVAIRPQFSKKDDK
jgi:hypothetical protein